MAGQLGNGTDDDLSDVLYRDYVGNFKRHDRPMIAQLPRGFELWLDARLLPLLSRLPPNGNIHDLGCGDGLLLQYLKSRGFRSVKGVDLCEDQVARARSRGVDVEYGNLFDVLRASEEMVDVIIAIDLVEPLDRTGLQEFAQLVWGSLRPYRILLL